MGVKLVINFASLPLFPTNLVYLAGLDVAYGVLSKGSGGGFDGAGVRLSQQIVPSERVSCKICPPESQSRSLCAVGGSVQMLLQGTLGCVLQLLSSGVAFWMPNNSREGDSASCWVLLF